MSLIFIVFTFDVPFHFSSGLIFRIWVPFKEDRRLLQLSGHILVSLQAGLQKCPPTLWATACVPTHPYEAREPSGEGLASSRPVHALPHRSRPLALGTAGCQCASGPVSHTRGEV